MKETQSAEAAVAEVSRHTGVDLTVDEIKSLYSILMVQRKDTLINSHLRKAHHRLGDLEHLPEGENWWDKVHKDMAAADDDPFVDEEPGSHKHPVAHDRKAVIFWLEHRILPALTEEDAASVTSDETSGTAQAEQPKATGKPASGQPGVSGQGPLADAKKRRGLERYAMAAATRYYEKQWDVETVSHIKGVLDLLLVHRISGEARRVEVKGSSQVASHVEVTKAEVDRSREGACELFVLDQIEYLDTGPGFDDYTCEGGRRRVGEWCAADKDLTPKTYDYRLGDDFGKVHTS